MGLSRVLVGHVAVDAGLMWVGDPCYVIGKLGESKDRRQAEPKWNRVWCGEDGAFCEELEQMDENRDDADPRKGNVYPFNLSKEIATGIAVSSGYGDGVYPVYVDLDSNDRVASVTVEFTGEEEEDDEETCFDCGWNESDCHCWEQDGWCDDCGNPEHECCCDEEG